MSRLSDDHVDVEELVQRLDGTVAERFRSGLYPSDLERELSGHFDRVSDRISDRARRRPDDMGPLLQRLEQAANISVDRIPRTSSMPFGGALHGLIARLVRRQTFGLALQLRQYTDVLNEVLEAMVDRAAEPERAVESQVDSVLDQVARRVRSLNAPAGAPAGERSAPWLAVEAFMATFRGSPDAIAARAASLAEAVGERSPVVDLGCGRGEMLDLLQQRGLEVTGVDLDPEIVALVQARGLRAVEADVVDYLGRQPDGSLGAVLAIQLAEHLAPARLHELVSLAQRKLRRDGRLVIETVNPASLYVLAHAYYLDPTHVTPVHPLYLRFLVEQAGFAVERVEYRSPVPGGERLEPVPAAAEVSDELRGALDRNAERLNGLVYGPQDYAVIATRR